MVKQFLCIAVLASASGCGIRADRARDGTLPFHPTYEQLRSSTSKANAPATRQSAARIVIDGFARAYPQPIGLHYNDHGAMRRVIGIEVADGAVELALADSLQRRILGTNDPSRPTITIGGGLVELARYRFGDRVHASGLLELRVMRDGNEIYAARYRTIARGSSSPEVTTALVADLTDQVMVDQQLFGAIEGGTR